MYSRKGLSAFVLTLIATLPALLVPTASADESATADGLSLELIMQNPDWLGRQPQDAWWSWNGETVYYTRKREGVSIEDTWALPATGGTPRRLEAAELAEISAARGVLDRKRNLRAFIRNGDVFVRDRGNGTLHQLTRTAAEENNPRFLTDGDVAWRSDGDWFAADVQGGAVRQLATLKTEDDPAGDPEKFDYLHAQQMRLFSTLREEEADETRKREHDRAQQQADPSRPPLPFWLGKDTRIIYSSLSPNARWLLVVTENTGYDAGRHDSMPTYVTRDGYVQSREVRTLVGENPPAPQSLLLLDLTRHARHKIPLNALPGIEEDPLEELREDALAWHVKHGAPRDAVARALEAPDRRPVTIPQIEWNDTGSQAAVQLRSIDNKDRWIATVDFDTARLVPQHRLHDRGWINWTFNQYGWLPDNRTLWLLSEQSGYSHLYLKPLDDDLEQLTEGAWEVSSPAVDADGSHIYFVANRQHPGWHDIYRVAVNGGEPERLTDIGVTPEDRVDTWLPPFYLSPDESQLLFRHGSMNLPPELYVQANRAGAEARRLTQTVSEQFLAHDWMQPEIVEVPSSHVERPIHARLYLPADYDPDREYPAVMFVHGAGYLHNVHYGWSSYFREYMFHNLLTRHGYVVIDMDYRGSAGYGRDWRTAIYRQMGHPELEDYLDGKRWLVENYHVDPERVGIYGGSYGGFMTFMALFRAPEAFAAGASLRPVTDWAHYNHEYTSNILNTPLVDPMAYEKSSPIEFAEQYANRPLAIFHGMQDDNVFYKDTVRLTQRLLELEKENYYPMYYPLDPHGFVHAYAWLDEYRRIFALFEENLKKQD